MKALRSEISETIADATRAVHKAGLLSDQKIHPVPKGVRAQDVSLAVPHWSSDSAFSLSSFLETLRTGVELQGASASIGIWMTGMMAATDHSTV